MSTQEFNCLVLNNSDGLLPYALHLTRDQELARDLFQETVCKALTYRESFRPGTQIRAWLFTIMRNVFINDYRRDRKKKVVYENYQYNRQGATDPSTMSVGLKEIQQAIHQLPALMKLVCQLYLLGYKYQEIALVLDEPLGTVKSRIHFAKKLLQEKLER